MKISSIIVHEIGFDNSPYLHQESFPSYEAASNRVKELAEQFIKDYDSNGSYHYDSEDRMVVDTENNIIVTYIIDWTEINI